MADPRLNYEKVVKILIDYHLLDDRKKVCEKWQIGERTLRAYRARIRKDERLAIMFREHYQYIMADWKKKAEKCMESQIDTIEYLTKKAEDTANPKYLPDISESLKVVGDLYITAEALSAGDVEKIAKKD